MALPRPAAIPEYPRSKYDGARMSLAEYESLPEEKPYLEYWDGVVIQKAVPKLPHVRAANRMVVLLDRFVEAFGGESGPEGHIWFEGRGWLVPDVVYWAPGKIVGDRERMLPPTLAVETRSNRQSLPRLLQKCRNMRAEGVDVCWLIDPLSHLVYVFEGDRDGEVLPQDGVLESPHLPGFSFALPRLWAEVDR